MKKDFAYTPVACHGGVFVWMMIGEVIIRNHRNPAPRGEFRETFGN